MFRSVPYGILLYYATLSATEKEIPPTPTKKGNWPDPFLSDFIVISFPLSETYHILTKILPNDHRPKLN